MSLFRLFLSIFFFFSIAAWGDVRLPKLIGDGMVLQRNAEINIWGWADPDEAVAVVFDETSYNTKTDSSGNWSIKLSKRSAGGPFTMTIRGKNTLTVKDILIGDVWLCSGQSNMELPVARVMDMFSKEVKTYTNPMIRYITVPLAYNFHQPQSDIQATSWKTLTPENAMSFSAIAYFFAKDLYEKIKIPIGLINSSVGGSPAEAWISEEGLKSFPMYLNDMRICQNDEYVSNVKSLDRKRWNIWNSVLSKQDAGLNETKQWFEVDYDDSSWNKTDLFDNYWGNDGLNPVNGSFWFRKTFEVPESKEGKTAVLRLGSIVDADSVYINGIFVGTTSYRYPPRIYQIPEGLLKKGENQITIRLFSYSGYPEFVKDKPYKIVFDDTEINLEGEWKYKSGTPMPSLQGETFFHYKPVGLYNGMIAPLLNYKIKGVLWYQGESNTGRYNEYQSLLSTLIGDWRYRWNQSDLPFFIVQLANFMQAYKYPTESNWAALRDAQLQVSQTVSNTGLAVTIDLGEWNDIHPLNKKEVGRRLSLLVQNMVYKDESVVSNGPVYKSMTIEGNKIILSFEEETNNLQPVEELKGFAIAGKDEKFVWAKAIINNNKVIVWNDDVLNPVIVRYAWADNPEGANLRNKEGLPASPFQTNTLYKTN